MSELISKEAALKVACDTCQFVSCPDDDKCDEYEAMKNLPSAEQQPSIPLSWIEKHLEWLDNCDNDFAELAKVSIRAMIRIWEDGE